MLPHFISVPIHNKLSLMVTSEYQSDRFPAHLVVSSAFLVACYATLHPALSVRRSVGWSFTHLLKTLKKAFWAAAPKGDEILQNTGGLQFVPDTFSSQALNLTIQILPGPLRLQIRLDGHLSLGKAFRLLKAFNQCIIAHQCCQAGQTKVPLCSTGLRPLRGRCPAYYHLRSPTYKAGQRVSLTTYCPWATCWAVAPKGPMTYALQVLQLQDRI